MDAVKLLVAEQEHHALCWRSIYTMPHYEELLVTTARSTATNLSVSEKAQLVRGLEWIEINLESAKNEINADYDSVTRRTVIVLADIVENVVESTVAICLLHLDPAQASLREVTTYKRDAKSERDFKQAVRRWESRLFSDLPDRTMRIDHMIRAFFPSFEAPREFGTLDNVFDARNQFTHEAIRLTENEANESIPKWSLSDVDEAFRVAGDFLTSIMRAIPGDLESPISPFVDDAPS